ncbi:MAG: Gfo/Idh/MocA family oxidoreductase [Thermoanaerobaculia bacterium]
MAELERRVGWALVGLGSLTLEQVLPAFARCRYSRAVALVSADRGKIRRLARQYGIPEDAVYDDGSFDRLAANEAVEVVYLVLPDDAQAGFAVRAARAGKHVLCEKPISAAAGRPDRTLKALRAASGSLQIAYRSSLGPPDGAPGADPLALELDRFSLSVRRIAARSGTGTERHARRAGGMRESA